VFLWENFSEKNDEIVAKNKCNQPKCIQDKLFICLNRFYVRLTPNVDKAPRKYFKDGFFLENFELSSNAAGYLRLNYNYF
jgi:hypothetical protein